tara:strand:- start:281 stop:847 length:567 start_codon:yes stop_codon:yes gene_type:complete
LRIGILAFQGDFKLHESILKKLNVSPELIKNKEQLKDIDALIIPGGESTVISKMLIKNNFITSLKEFSKNKSIYGTCAGAILMSSNCNDERVNTLSIIDIEANRNAWGRQIDSFIDDIELSFSLDEKFAATFIRAPKFKIINNAVEVLSTYKKEPVLIRNKKHLISSFHPEVNDDLRIHKYFIEMIND